jgi:hypothetical protein
MPRRRATGRPPTPRRTEKGETAPPAPAATDAAPPGRKAPARPKKTPKETAPRGGKAAPPPRGRRAPRPATASAPSAPDAPPRDGAQTAAAKAAPPEGGAPARPKKTPKKTVRRGGKDGPPPPPPRGRCAPTAAATADPPPEDAAAWARDQAGHAPGILAQLLEDADYAAGAERPTADPGADGALYATFIAETKEAVRAVAVDANLTVAEHLRAAGALLDGARASGRMPAVDGAFCERCTYVGSCSAFLCRKQPASVVRILAPRRAGGGYTLCFDAAQLEPLLADFRREGRLRMANPVHTLGVTGGHAVDPEQFAATLDAETVAALEWQVVAWREWSALAGRVSADRGQRLMLRSLILPALARFAEEHLGGPGEATGGLARLWKRGLRQVGRGALKAADILLASIRPAHPSPPPGGGVGIGL